MKIRRIVESDKPILAEMIWRDQDHIARGVLPEFFMSMDHFSICFEDDLGPVFYVRLDPDCVIGIQAVRVHIQFDQKSLIRTARMLFEGFEVVKDRCRAVRAQLMVFDSIDATLRTFCMKRFGFQPIPGTADLELWIGEKPCLVSSKESGA